MGDIFREVDEELRQERYTELWRRYGKYAIGGVVLIVAAVAGWKGWETYQTSQRHAEGLRFSEALVLAREGNNSAAEDRFAALAQDTSSGYGILSRFHQASITARGGDSEGAIRIYDAISEDGGVPDSLRDLATILAGFQALHLSSVPTDALEARIRPLAVPGKAYRHTALELLALSAYRTGDVEGASSHYQQIVDDAEAPASVRGRALQMLNILKAQ